jgi:RHS repeat-associated protein
MHVPPIFTSSSSSIVKTLQRILVMLLWCVTLIASHARADTITYFHNDLLGSPATATNESGTVIWREAYRGYGERIKNESSSVPNKVWYTSRHQDEDTGLVYMGARYYDPALGRFLSVDAVGFNEQNVHSFNRYAYANNNPYKFKDTDGNSPLSVFILEVAKQTGAGYLLGVAADSVSQYAAFGEVSLSLAATSSSAIAGGESGLLSGALAGAFKAYAVAGAVKEESTATVTLVRKALGADGAQSAQIIEREGGTVISRTHEVIKDGKVIHQHKNSIGKSGAERQFPDEWTGTKTINAPYENIPPSFPADRVLGGRN